MSNQILDLIETPKLGKWIAQGFLVIAIFFTIFGSWAGLVPIDAATVAKGTIETTDKRKTVQHLEGGIVREIHVQEHSPIKKGQLLIKLDKTRAQAALNLVRNQYLSALALESRLQAERNKQTSIKWSPVLNKNEPLALEAMQEQNNIFQKRTTSHTGQLEVLKNKIEKTEKALIGTKRQLSSLNKHFSLISREVENTRTLTKRGLTTTQKLMALEREKLGIEERLRSLETRISAGKYEIDSDQLQLVNQENTYENEVAESLQLARLNISDLSQKLIAAEDFLERTDIIAPQDGVVINLATTTLGSVIGAGEIVMEIVPSTAKFSVETRIDPYDIDVVQTGALARIRLTSYKSRITPALEGTVLNVSADVLSDVNNGENFYNAVIIIKPESLLKYPGLKLYPGMPADVMIISDSRTIIGYLFQPVFESFTHAFREK